MFHLVGTRIECLQQMAMTSLKVIENIGQLGGRDRGIERQDSVDNMIRPVLVDGIEVARFCCRLEGAHDHPRRIRAKIESLPVHERRL